MADKDIDPFVEAIYSKRTHSFLSPSTRSFIAAHISVSRLQQKYISVHLVPEANSGRIDRDPRGAQEHHAQEKHIYLRPNDMLYVLELCYLDVFDFIEQAEHHKIGNLAVPTTARYDSARLGNQVVTDTTLITSLSGLQVWNLSTSSMIVI